MCLVFRAAGTSHLASFLLNNFIWGLSILVVFCIGFFLFNDEKAGLFGALIFALIPEGIIWSNTTAVEPSAAFLAGLALLSVIFLAKHPGKMPLFLASVLLPFAFQFRPESVLILVPAGLVLVLMAPKELATARLHIFALLFLVLALPHFIHLYAVKGEAWGAPGGAKFAAAYFAENLNVNALFYFKNERFPVLFTFLFLVGLLVPQLKDTRSDRKRKMRIESFPWKEKCILFSWFMAFWGILLFFYAGSYNFRLGFVGRFRPHF
jgi:4-amino-4-deoxy-L-arabinose transferase-like glycosyltransferase